MCRVCQMKEMSREELAAVMTPIVEKVNEGEGLNNAEATDLVAYGTFLELGLAEAKSLIFQLSLRQMFNEMLDGVSAAGKAGAEAGAELKASLPEPAPEATPPAPELSAEEEQNIRRLLGGINLGE